MLGAVKKMAAGGIVGYTKEDCQDGQSAEDGDLMFKLCPGWEKSILKLLKLQNMLCPLLNSLINNPNVNKS